ncbi:acyltransferase [Alteromonas lipotrueiana]|uniref:acyltransferase n=1 Tax=Alteromonas lipotrueiana TaxID=2803815 RepID=UPI001C437B9D|nr:acyltransferase [Alteromonas lipotrueiana]
MRTVFIPVIFTVHLTAQIFNLAFWGSLIIGFGLFRLVLPVSSVQKLLATVMQCLLLTFGRLSVALIQLFNPVVIERRFSAPVSRDSWYLIVANHLSYLDIILLIELASNRFPAPKFFLKKELIWLPFVGLGAWALDMPFMRRYSAAHVAKHPHLKGKDIDTTRRYCQKFSNTPTTVINFVEGTRFTAAKHAARQSNYQTLLPPKAGGVAFTLATMGDLFTNILDISLLYPQNRKHPMMAMLCGQMRHIIIDVNVLAVPAQTQGDYFSDATYRTQFQHWLNDLWKAKDQRISHILETK